jgi:hypothetical protein
MPIPIQRREPWWASPTAEVFEMHGPGPDGKEMKMMEITYKKK